MSDISDIVERLRAENANLRNALGEYAESVEKIAFSMQAPNEFTPLLVSIAINAKMASMKTV
jgi:hypothetical protein